MAKAQNKLVFFFSILILTKLIKLMLLILYFLPPRPKTVCNYEEININ